MSLGLYGTCSLNLLEIYPKWIIGYGIINTNRNYMKYAHSFDEKFILENVDNYILKNLGLKNLNVINPIYDSIIIKDLPNAVIEEFNRRKH